MIVKVQLSQYTTEDEQQVLVYNKSKSIFYEETASKKIIGMMAGRFKAFFKARLEKDGTLTLKKPAKWQEW